MAGTSHEVCQHTNARQITTWQIGRHRYQTNRKRRVTSVLVNYNWVAVTLVRLPAAPVDFRRAHAALVRATRLADVVRIRDSAEAVRVACTKAKAGLAMANQAAELRIRAERKAGRLLLGVERSDAGRPTKNSHHRGGNFARVLRDLDLPDTTARRWQRRRRSPRTCSSGSSARRPRRLKS